MDFIRKLFPAPGGQKLADRLMKEFRRAGVEGPMHFDPESWVIDVGEEDGIRVNLANLHADLALNPPWRRKAIIRRFASHLSSGAMDRPGSLAEAADRLLPNLRDSAMWEFLRLDSALRGHDGIDVPRSALTPRISAALYIDAENGMSMVSHDDLERWDVTFDDALEVALANLAARSTEPFEEVAPGVWSSPWADCYDTARLLLPSKLREVEVDGDLVAFCPHWNSLLLTGSNHIAGLAACLSSAAEQIREAPKPMSAQPMVRRYPGWEMLRFGRGHDLYETWARARVYEMAGVYHDQQSVLQAWCEQQGDDVYVAQFNGVEEEKTKRVSSYCVWGRSVVALLPEADEVAFYDDDQPEDRKITRVDWDVMWALCEPLLTATDHVPTRWRVESYPTPETLQMMVEVQERRAQR